jgi:hypothetical protein
MFHPKVFPLISLKKRSKNIKIKHNINKSQKISKLLILILKIRKCQSIRSNKNRIQQNRSQNKFPNHIKCFIRIKKVPFFFNRLFWLIHFHNLF